LQSGSFVTIQEFFDSLTPAERARVNFVDPNSKGLDRESEERLQQRWDTLMRGIRNVSYRPREDVGEALQRFLGRKNVSG
jgi:hypothetical protein